MRRALTILFFIILNSLIAQNIYKQHYGDYNNSTIIFIYGGPSGNSNLFEVTTAQKLAVKGFYVNVYDRWEEDLSRDVNATITFDESFNDLLGIYKIYNIEKANIHAHSFEGIIAVLFTNKYPEKVKSLILVDALFSQQGTYNHILRKAKKKRYQYLLKEKGIVQSMSRKGNCLDNAIIENFFGILKLELFYIQKSANLDELKWGIKQYINYYNNVIIKSNLSKMSPTQYRAHYYQN